MHFKPNTLILSYSNAPFADAPRPVNLFEPPALIGFSSLNGMTHQARPVCQKLANMTLIFRRDPHGGKQISLK
jgi:hypothetical protein